MRLNDSEDCYNKYMSFRILLILIAMASVATAAEYSEGEIEFLAGENRKSVEIA